MITAIDLPVDTARYIGTYQITGQLGTGAFGSVFSAYQPFLDRKVAIKSLHTNFLEQGMSERLFINEGQVIARLRHPNIISIYEFGIAQDSSTNKRTAFMIMEFLSGGTLADRLADEPLSIEETVRLVEQIAQGLAYAHERNVVHRDLKPANILFTTEGEAVIADFGLAKLAQNTLSEVSMPMGSLTDMEATLMGSGLMGTPLYAAPEQLMGKGISIKTDQYALGLISFQMLTGVVPFKSDNIVDILTRRAKEPPPPASSYAPHLPRAVDAVLQRALAIDPADRFDSVSEFVKAFGEALLPDRQHERVIQVIDPLQAMQMQTARRYMTGFLTAVGLFMFIVILFCTAEFIRGFNNSTAPEFLWDGLIVSTAASENGYRVVNGVMPGSKADVAGYQTGDEIPDDLILDKRVPGAQFLVNGVPRSLLNADWKPKPGDTISRSVLRDGTMLVLTYTLNRSPYQLYILVSTVFASIVCLICGLWLLRRWGPEPSLQVFVPLMFLFGFFLVARSVANLILYLDTLSFHLTLAVALHLILIFPVEMDWMKKHPRRIWWIYAPVSVGLFYFLTHTRIILPVINLPLNAFDYVLYTVVILGLLVFKWLRRDVKQYPGIWWTVGGVGFAMLLTAYYVIVFYLLPASFVNDVLGGVALQTVINDVLLAVLQAVVPILSTIGLHRIQKQIGSTFIVMPEATVR